MRDARPGGCRTGFDRVLLCREESIDRASELFRIFE